MSTETEAVRRQQQAYENEAPQVRAVHLMIERASEAEIAKLASELDRNGVHDVPSMTRWIEAHCTADPTLESDAVLDADLDADLLRTATKIASAALVDQLVAQVNGRSLSNQQSAQLSDACWRLAGTFGDDLDKFQKYAELSSHYTPRPQEQDGADAEKEQARARRDVARLLVSSRDWARDESKQKARLAELEAALLHIASTEDRAEVESMLLRYAGLEHSFRCIKRQPTDPESPQKLLVRLESILLHSLEQTPVTASDELCASLLAAAEQAGVIGGPGGPFLALQLATRWYELAAPFNNVSIERTGSILASVVPHHGTMGVLFLLGLSELGILVSLQSGQPTPLCQVFASLDPQPFAKAGLFDPRFYSALWQFKFKYHHQKVSRDVLRVLLEDTLARVKQHGPGKEQLQAVSSLPTLFGVHGLAGHWFRVGEILFDLRVAAHNSLPGGKAKSDFLGPLLQRLRHAWRIDKPAKRVSVSGVPNAILEAARRLKEKKQQQQQQQQQRAASAEAGSS